VKVREKRRKLREYKKKNERYVGRAFWEALGKVCVLVFGEKQWLKKNQNTISVKSRQRRGMKRAREAE
jgi:hypothetical protein